MHANYSAQLSSFAESSCLLFLLWGSWNELGKLIHFVVAGMPTAGTCHIVDSLFCWPSSRNEFPLLRRALLLLNQQQIHGSMVSLLSNLSVISSYASSEGQESL